MKKTNFNENKTKDNAITDYTSNIFCFYLPSYRKILIIYQPINIIIINKLINIWNHIIY